MKLNCKFGIYCFCTGVFLANCSPENNENNGGGSSENNRGSSNNKKEILAAINNNKKISPQVKKCLEKSIEKENKITQVNRKTLSTGSTEEVLQEVRKLNVENSNVNKLCDILFNKVAKSVSETYTKMKSVLNEKYLTDEKNVLVFLLNFGIKIPYEYAFLSHEEELKKLNDSKYIDFLKSNLENVFTKDYMNNLFGKLVKLEIRDNDFEKIKSNIKNNIDPIFSDFIQFDYQNMFLSMDNGMFGIKSTFDEINKTPKKDIQELSRMIEQGIERNISEMKKDFDNKISKLSSKSEKIKDFLKTHKDYKQEDVASFQEMLQSL